jgi:hypothetical protein
LTDISNTRLAYELIIGRCSDNHWRDVRKTLIKNHMELTIENIQFFAEIRQIIPRSAIGVQGVLKCYTEAEQLLNKTNRKLKGLEILTILNQYGIKPHQSTITRWFKPLGGYRREKEYSPQDLKPIFTSAFIYRAIQTTKPPNKNTWTDTSNKSKPA